MQPRRIPWLVTIVALVALSGGRVWALDALTSPASTALPGTYVTLGFEFTGTGVFDYEVAAPIGWSPLNREGRLEFRERGYLSVTVRVPNDAPGASIATVSVSLREANDQRERLRAFGTVEILARAYPEVLAPESAQGTVGEPLRLPFTVRNAGNVDDTITIVLSRGMWTPVVIERTLELAAGEARDLIADLRPTGRTSTGFRQVLRIEARSHVDPTSVRRRAVSLTFGEREANGPAGTGSRDAPPGLTLSIRSGLQGGLEVTQDGTSASLDYFVQPGLTGDLSDYVSGSLNVGGLAGNLEDPFATVPSGVALGMSSEEWDAFLSARPGSYDLGGGGLVADGAWRIGGDVGYRDGDVSPVVRLEGYVLGQDTNLDLQVFGGTRFVDGGRRDRLVARYRVPLGTAVTARVGASLLGSALASEGSYRVDVGLDQGLSWQTRIVDVSQSYSGVPMAGLHTIGVSGGLRGIAPFGVRAATSLRFEPTSYESRTTLSITGRPTPYVFLSLAGDYVTGTTGTRWRASPAITYRFRAAGVGAELSARYAYSGVLSGDAESRSRYRLGATFDSGPLVIAAAGEYATSDGGADPAYRVWTVLGAGRLEPHPDARIEAEYERVRTVGQDTTTEAAFQVRWRQRWSDWITTSSTYERIWTREETASEQTERAGVSLGIEDTGLAGLDLHVGYAVSSDVGLFSDTNSWVHDLRARIAYSLELSFETPTAAVDAFGGRRGGSVFGIAYVDENLNGRLDEGETTFPGLRVELGEEVTTTDAEGAYRIRVPSGHHAWSFGSGISVRYAAVIDGSIRIEDDSERNVDLRFVPVARLEVSVFDDADQDGIRDAGEAGIGFAGVRIEGPSERTVRVDREGNATVTNLVPGEYRVRPDPALLPPRYRSTGDAIRIMLRADDPLQRVLMGASAPPRESVTTFTTTQLAVLPRVEPRSAPAGADIVLTALVNGHADNVVAELAGRMYHLEPLGQGRWSSVIRLPRDLALGPVEIATTASSADAPPVSSRTLLSIVDRALFAPRTLRTAPNAVKDVRIELAFAAESLELRLPDRVVPMATVDGFVWTGRIPGLPAAHGVEAIDVVADGELIGRIEIQDAESPR